MAVYEIIETHPQPYIFIEHEAAFGPEMQPLFADAFGKLWQFREANGVTPVGPPMSVTMHVEGNRARFRVSLPVSAEDARKATGEIRSDTLAAGKAVHATHTGDYVRLSETYVAVMKWMTEQGHRPGMPCWEVYVDDPGEVAVEKLRTEIFMPVA